MLYDAIPIDEFYNGYGDAVSSRSIRAFMHFIERKLGTRSIYPRSRIPYGRPDLLHVFQIADTLQKAKVVDSYTSVLSAYDEPHIHEWSAQCLGRGRSISGGMSFESDEKALLATLAEALERVVWSDEIDYYVAPRVATSEHMANTNAILPERFVGFSNEIRSKNPKLTLSPHDEHLWIRGFSHIERKNVFVPAQIVSPVYWNSPLLEGKKEQTIWTPITTGLATWPTRIGALLAGALEVIERDAYMIMWLNQLSLPRIDMEEFRASNTTLDSLIRTCERYRLRVHVMHLPTDAPTDVVCAVIEDTTGHAPLFAIGAKAHRDIVHSIEGESSKRCGIGRMRGIEHRRIRLLPKK